MPRFPASNRLALPATFERFVEGQLHPNGQRYLPLILLRLANTALIGVVDRHHRVDPALEGQLGTARLVFLLSSIESQPPGSRRAELVVAETGRATTAPDIFGQVLEVLTWETEDRTGVTVLYTELLLEIGLGVVGLRTSAPLRDLRIERRIEAGDWLAVRRSRIDILAFDAASS